MTTSDLELEGRLQRKVLEIMKASDFISMRASDQLRLIEDLQFDNKELRDELTRTSKKLTECQARSAELLEFVRSIVKPGHPILKSRKRK